MISVTWENSSKASASKIVLLILNTFQNHCERGVQLAPNKTFPCKIQKMSQNKNFGEGPYLKPAYVPGKTINLKILL